MVQRAGESLRIEGGGLGYRGVWDTSSAAATTVVCVDSNAGAYSYVRCRVVGIPLALLRRRLCVWTLMLVPTLRAVQTSSAAAAMLGCVESPTTLKDYSDVRARTPYWGAAVDSSADSANSRLAEVL
jgi:hypothetical protein